MRFCENLIKNKIIKKKIENLLEKASFWLHAVKTFILSYTTFTTMIVQRVMSPSCKFSSREYSFRSTVILVRIVYVCEREKILASFPLDLTVKQRRGASSVKVLLPPTLRVIARI